MRRVILWVLVSTCLISSAILGRSLLTYIGERDAEVRIRSVSIKHVIHHNEVNELKRRLVESGVVAALEGDIEGVLLRIIRKEKFADSVNAIFSAGAKEHLGQDAIDRILAEAIRWKNLKALEYLRAYGINTNSEFRLQ